MNPLFPKYRLLLCVAVAIAFFALPVYSQTVIGGDTMDASAMLDVQSLDRGVLLPRLTTAQREAEILARRVPGAPQALAAQVVAFVQHLRSVELYKLPGVAETIEWTRALMELNAIVLDPEVVQNTLGLLLKYQDDIARVEGDEAMRLLDQIRAEADAGV